MAQQDKESEIVLKDCLKGSLHKRGLVLEEQSGGEKQLQLCNSLPVLSQTKINRGMDQKGSGGVSKAMKMQSLPNLENTMEGLLQRLSSGSTS